MISISDYLRTLEPFYGIRWVETIDFDQEDGLETTLWCIRYRKSDKSPVAKKAFITSENRNRVNSDLYFNHMCGWRILFEKKYNSWGYCNIPMDELYETDQEAPGISKVELLWDINDLHRLIPETKYFDDVPKRAIIKFIKMWRIHPEVEYVWKDKDLQWFWSDTRIYNLKNKQQVIKIIKEHKCSLNDALGMIKYGNEERMLKERAINRYKKLFKDYKISREHLANFDKYFSEQQLKVSDYMDYLDLCIYFRKSLKEYGVLFPRKFMETHDQLVELKKMKEEKSSIAKRKRYEKRFGDIAQKYAKLLNSLSNDTYTLAIPTTVQQFITVGNKMHNCVGTNGYDKKMYQGKCLIIVAYKKKTPVVCVELNDKFKIRQIRGKKNMDTKPCDDVKPLINMFTRKAVSVAA